MYRGRLWTMRQFAGFGTPEDTNQRFKYLLEHGMTGLSTAFDMPALMGYDADHPMSRGEVGSEGVAVSTLKDFEVLFERHPARPRHHLDDHQRDAPSSRSCMLHRGRGEAGDLRRTSSAAPSRTTCSRSTSRRRSGSCRPRPAMRMVVDMIEYTARHMPRWHPVSISGYHIREAGATAIQELAFTLADGFGYVEECMKRGMEVDDFAPRLSASSGTCTTTSSRRSPSSARRGASRRGSMRRGSARRSRES